MLHPKRNRLDYGEQLIPPPGYELAYAVGTTYSLDLEALVVLPVALFYSQTLDATPGEIRYDMLDAITQTASKISIFCQKGKIQVPRKYQYLIAFWEKGITEVLMPDAYSSFHPKVWVIRFEAPGKPACYRVIVTSRNLTFARDWDVAFSTEGVVGKSNQEQTRPLLDFLQYLSLTSGGNFPKEFLKDLAKVSFDIPAGFDSLAFYPIGFPVPSKRVLGVGISGNKGHYINPLASRKWEELLIISPFVDDRTASHFASLCRRKPALFSRKEELDALDAATVGEVDCYQFSTMLEEAERSEHLSEAGLEEPSLQSLHAKFYIGRQNKTNHWLLGSANSTQPAFGRNIEFLVELQGNAYAQRPKEILTLLTDSSKSEVALFEPYDLERRPVQADSKEQEAALRALLFELTSTPVTGSVEQAAGGTVYDLTLQVDASSLRVKPGFEVRIKPLPERGRPAAAVAPGRVNVIANYYTGYEERQLSPFMQWEIWYQGECLKQFVVQVDIELPATRLNRIFTFFIDNRDKFLRYLTFLLSGDSPEVISWTEEEDPSEENMKPGQETGASLLDGAPVFEKLLFAASRSPHKLRSVEQLISRLKLELGRESDKQIISPEFEELWDVFKVYLERKSI